MRSCLFFSLSLCFYLFPSQAVALSAAISFPPTCSFCFLPVRFSVVPSNSRSAHLTSQLLVLIRDDIADADPRTCLESPGSEGGLCVQEYLPAVKRGSEDGG